MRIMRYLIQNVNPLNLLLLTVTVIAAVVVIFPLTRMNAGYILPQVKVKTTEQVEKTEEKGSNIVPSDYILIGEANLFHPERHIPVDKRTEEIPKPDLILYGTMMQGSVEMAFIEDKKNPKTTPGRGNRQTVIKKGDTIGGFVLTEIRADRIMLMRGDEKMTVLLTNIEKRKEQAGAQKSMQTATPGLPASAASTPGSPFGPTPSATGALQRPGGRQAGASPSGQMPATTPQPLQRGEVFPGSGGILPVPAQKK